MNSHLAKEAVKVFNGEVEFAEGSFSKVHKDKRGRDASVKVVIWGMPKHHDKVYTFVVQNTKAKTLINEISLKIRPESVDYSDAYHSYDA